MQTVLNFFKVALYLIAICGTATGFGVWILWFANRQSDKIKELNKNGRTSS